MSKTTDVALSLRDMLDEQTDDWLASAIQFKTFDTGMEQACIALVDEHDDMMFVIVKRAPRCGVCEQAPAIHDDCTIMCACGEWPGRWDV